MRKIFCLLFLYPILLFSQSWVLKNNGIPVNIDLYDISFSSMNPSHGIAVGAGGFISYTSDGGNNWIIGSSGTTFGVYEVNDIDGLTGYAVGQNRLMLKTTDGGKSWFYMQPTLTNAHAQGVHFPDINNGFIVGTDGSRSIIYHTTDGGSTWGTPVQPVPDWQLNAVNFFNTSIGIAVGNNGVIHRTINGGSSWVSSTSGVTDQLNDVIFLNSNIAIAVGANGKILRSTDAGATWTIISLGITTNLRGVGFMNSTEGFIVGYSGLILRTTDAGLTWNSISSPATNNIWGMMFVNSSTGFAAGYAGTIIKYIPGSSNWTVYRDNDYLLTGSKQVKGVGINPVGNVWIAVDGTNGGSSKFNGSTWDPLSKTGMGFSATTVLNTLGIDNTGNVWFGAHNVSAGTNLVNYNGSYWTPISNSTINSGVFYIGIDNGNNKWFSTGGSVVKYNGLDNWTQYPLSSYFPGSYYVMCLAAYNFSNNVWVGTSGGGAWRFNGSAWVQLPAVPFSTDVVNAIAAESGGNVWAGAEAGAYIARYNGTSWQKYGPLPTGTKITSITIEGSGIAAIRNKLKNTLGSDNAIWIGTDNGFVKYDGISFTAFTNSNTSGAMPGKYIYTIAIDAQGKKWIGTDSGLVVYNEPAVTSTPVISFNSSSLNFGDVTLGSGSNQSLTILNSGDANLIITSIQIAGLDSNQYSIISGGASPAAPITVIPGGSANVVIRFSPNTLGIKNSTLKIAHNASGSPSSIPISGKGKGTPLISLSSGDLQYGIVNVGTTSDKTLTISNTGNDTLTISSFLLVGANSNEFSIISGSAPVNIIPGSASNITLRFTPSSSGSKTASLEITHNASGSPSVISLTGTGYSLLPSISVNPSSLDFGNINPGESADLPIIIYNTGTANLLINSFSFTGTDASSFTRYSPDSSGIIITIQPGESYAVKIRFTPLAAGSKTANLIINNNTGVAVNVPLSGVGIQLLPGISVTPATLNFDTTLTGLSSEKEIVIKNTGTGNLIISNILIASSDSTLFKRFPLDSSSIQITLASGNSYNVKIRFSPVSEGNKSANLRIINNTGNNIDIPLSGFGKTPIPIIIPDKTNIAYDTVDVGGYSDQKITIKNNGTANLVITGIITAAKDSLMFTRYPSDSSLVPITILPGRSYTFTIRFTPVDGGIKNAVLRIFSNAGDPTEIPISGVSVVPVPVVTITETQIMFDSSGISVGGYSDYSITIKNTGKTNLEIYKTVTSGLDSMMFSRYPVDSALIKIVIAPQNSYTLRIRFTPQNAGEKITNLLIYHNASGGMISIPIKGKGVIYLPEISISDYSYDYGNITYISSDDKFFTIFNTGKAQLRINSITKTGDTASFFRLSQPDSSNIPILISPGSSYTIDIKFVPEKTGALNAILQLNHNAPSGSTQISLTGKGVTPQISFNKDSINFGNSYYEDNNDTTIIFTNTGEGILYVAHLELRGDTTFFKIIQYPNETLLNPNLSDSFRIRFLAGKSDIGKMKNVKVQFRTNIYQKNLTEYSISGKKVAPSIVYGTEILFGKIKVDSSKEISYTIGNSGLYNLSLKSIQLQGLDAAEFQTGNISTPITIMPSAEMKFTLKFLPKKTGMKDAQLVISTNDPNNPQINIKISAEGIKQNLVSSISAIDFGKVSIAKTKDTLFTLQDQGSEIINIFTIMITGNDSLLFTFPDLTATTSIKLNPGESKDIKVRFSPVTGGIKNAVIETRSSDILNPVLSINTSGNAVIPKISTQPSILDFGTLKINNTSILPIYISNPGEGILKIKNNIISGLNSDDFSLGTNMNNKELAPGIKDSIQVQFNPKSAGNKNAVLITESNDPQKLFDTLILAGKCKSSKIQISLSSINFGRMLVLTKKDTSFIISNSGTDILIIKNISIPGGDTIKTTFLENVSGLSINPGETKKISLQFQPQREGIKLSKIIIESDDPSTGISEINISGEGVLPAITLESSSIAPYNQDIPISFSLENLSVPSAVRIFYKMGGATKYDSTQNISPELTNRTLNISGSSLKYKYTFPRNIITFRGLDYYIKTVWSDQVINTLPKEYLIKPLSFQISFGTEPLSPGFMIYPAQYHMFSAPVLFSGSSVFNELFSNFGAVNNSKWRIFKYNGGANIEVIDENSSGLNISDAFWLISRNMRDLFFKNGLTIPTNTAYTRKIGPGWNLISNPFLFPIPFSSLNIPAGKNISNTLWYWDLDRIYSIEKTSLNPWKGYFINNLENDSVEISFTPVLFTSSLAKGESAKNILQKDEWYLDLDLKIGEDIMKNLRIGCRNNSFEIWDKNDISIPPGAPDQSTFAFFPHNDWEKYPGNYAFDFRAPGRDGYIWNLEIVNNSDIKNGILNFNFTGNICGDYYLRIYDADNMLEIFKKNINEIINKTTFVNFSMADGNKKLNILVGTGKFIEEEKSNEITAITEYKLFQNYPNPFNPSTKIEFSIPKAGQTKLSVFNILGNEIAILVDSYLFQGKYRFEWNAKNLPSGIYTYILKSGNYVEAKKLILVK
jgi:photosystem II stability/assembly factor-like uncharacterized protein